MRFKNSLFLLLTILTLGSYKAQSDSSYYEGLIQFSGILVSNDSIEPVPYARIIDLNRRTGTVADAYGYFSFVAQKGDSIRFSSIGYKDSYFYISDTLKQSKYSLIHIMEADTIYLKEAVVYPWPSKEQFAEAFVNLDLPNDDYRRAEANLNNQAMLLYAQSIPNDGYMNYKQQMMAYQNKVYYAGQLPPNNLLNPIAWSKFIQAWKNGDFKRQP